MENIKELINQLFQSEQMVALITAVIAYLTANAGTIIAMAIGLVRQKIKEVKNNNMHNTQLIEMRKEYDERVNQIYNLVEAKITALDKHVCAKMDMNEEQRKAEIQAQALKIEEAVNETKKALKIDEILNTK